MADNDQVPTSIVDTMAGLLAKEDNPPADPPQDEPEESPEEQEETEESGVQEDLEDEEEDSSEEPDEEDSEDESSEEDDFVWHIPGEGELTTQEVKDGYLRQADYTRKTQKLADEKREFEQEISTVREKGQKYDEYLERLDTVLDSLMPKEEDLSELRKSNPAEYAARMADIQKMRDKQKAVQEERERRSQEKAQELQTVLAKEIEREQELLLQAIPEWKDSAIRDTESKEMVAVAKSLGFTDEELGVVTDHRVVKLLRMAAQQSRKEGLKPIVQKRTKRAPTVARPGAKKRRPTKKGQSQKLRENLRKTGSVHDAAAVFLNGLEAEK